VRGKGPLSFGKKRGVVERKKEKKDKSSEIELEQTRRAMPQEKRFSGKAMRGEKVSSIRNSSVGNENPQHRRRIDRLRGNFTYRPWDSRKPLGKRGAIFSLQKMMSLGGWQLILLKMKRSWRRGVGCAEKGGQKG